MSKAPMIEVHWSAHSEPDGTCPIHERQVSLLPAWAHSDRSVIDAVQWLAREHVLDDATWEEEYGLEAQQVWIWVTITSPAHLAGRYEVELRRVVVAEARKVG